MSKRKTSSKNKPRSTAYRGTEQQVTAWFERWKKRHKNANITRFWKYEDKETGEFVGVVNYWYRDSSA